MSDKLLLLVCRICKRLIRRCPIKGWDESISLSSCSVLKVERIFLRERQQKWISTGSFVLAKVFKIEGRSGWPRVR